MSRRYANVQMTKGMLCQSVPRNLLRSCGRLADFDRDPLDGLDAETVRTPRLAFSRRQLLEDIGGVIDERYRRETGEGSIGRRIRIAPAFVDQVDDAVVSPAERLGATAR